MKNWSARFCCASLGVLLVASGVSCGYVGPGRRAHAVTGATPKPGAGDRIALPPPGGEYEVIGAIAGIRSYVVRHDARLFRGGQPETDAGVEALRRLGVKTIVSATPTAAERRLSGKHGIRLVELPLEKNRRVPHGTLTGFLTAMREAPGPVYVHGWDGTHRAGVLGVAYRLHVLGWTYEKALVEFGRLGGSLRDDHLMLESVRELPR